VSVLLVLAAAGLLMCGAGIVLVIFAFDKIDQAGRR
jgi:hypothetical protein